MLLITKFKVTVESTQTSCLFTLLERRPADLFGARLRRPLRDVAPQVTEPVCIQHYYVVYSSSSTSRGSPHVFLLCVCREEASSSRLSAICPLLLVVVSTRAESLQQYECVCGAGCFPLLTHLQSPEIDSRRHV